MSRKPEEKAGTGVMYLRTLPDGPGSGRAVTIADLFGLPAGAKAWMVLIREVGGGQNSSRIGDANVSPANGIPLNTGDSFILPAAGLMYDLDQIWIYSPAADTLSIAILI